MRVFLTGGTGFIGLPLASALRARGWEITALVRNPQSKASQELARLGAELVRGDVTNRASLRRAMQGAGIVIHNAAWYELGIPKSRQPEMYAINVTGTDNVLGLAQELGIGRTVYVSSTVYYGDTGLQVRDETFRREAPYRVYYEQTKAEAHELALRYAALGLPLTLVCPGHVVGPNDHSPYGYFVRLYVNRLMPPLAWAPDTIHVPAHVDDISEGIALAAEKGRLGETYLLTGEPTPLRAIFAIWGEQPGGLRVRGFVPLWLAKLMFAPLEPVERWAGLPAFISREVVAGSASHYNFTSAKAQRELGWSYQRPRDLWSSIIAAENRLRETREKRNLVERLKPV